MSCPEPMRPVAASAHATRNSQHPAAPSSPRAAKFDEAALRGRSFLNIPEVAFLMRVSLRTVWRLMADPKSGFPEPRRIRGRTLLVRDEVIAFLQEGA